MGAQGDASVADESKLHSTRIPFDSVPFRIVVPTAFFPKLPSRDTCQSSRERTESLSATCPNLEQRQLSQSVLNVGTVLMALHGCRDISRLKRKRTSERTPNARTPPQHGRSYPAQREPAVSREFTGTSDFGLISPVEFLTCCRSITTSDFLC